MSIAEDIRNRIESHALPWKGALLRVGASIGIVDIDSTFVDPATVVAAADAACYAAKRSGKNAVRSHGTATLRLV
jgi:PleD family two-component response regulator